MPAVMTSASWDGWTPRPAAGRAGCPSGANTRTAGPPLSCGGNASPESPVCSNTVHLKTHLHFNSSGMARFGGPPKSGVRIEPFYCSMLGQLDGCPSPWDLRAHSDSAHSEGFLEGSLGTMYEPPFSYMVLSLGFPFLSHAPIYVHIVQIRMILRQRAFETSL